MYQRFNVYFDPEGKIHFEQIKTNKKFCKQKFQDL